MRSNGPLNIKPQECLQDKWANNIFADHFINYITQSIFVVVPVTNLGLTNLFDSNGALYIFTVNCVKMRTQSDH